MFLVDAVEAKRDWDTAVAHVKGILTKFGAEMGTNYKWDERKLAYAIGPHKRGTYYLVYFKADPNSIAGIRRDCDLSEIIIRQLILALDKEMPPMPTEEEMAKHRADLSALLQPAHHMM
jgi:small subunit ribosomal protein S6